ncbi:MAG: hypothetical protein KF760_14900 [Candidatus Eremiobacteraeota bacterium]|nr:hypothetical protein [Candidatus Eremiobacteraeota bacterium]MCW5866328.1 hypothetical protein [Candidatus Eremiobacteraeota bacterium]
MGLENELDQLDESGVESWLARCFEACDPRYDSDWLNGIFELALMQFPDNYEVRAAASRAATMEAQRLYDEGDTGEAVSRLERLLESDPYCTEAFELLERFMATGSDVPEAPTPEPVAPAPEPTPPTITLAPTAAAAEPVAQSSPVATLEPMPEHHDDELLSFLDDDLMVGLENVVQPDLPPREEPVAVPPAAVEAASPAPADATQPVALQDPAAPVAPTPEPVLAPDTPTAILPIPDTSKWLPPLAPPQPITPPPPAPEPAPVAAAAPVAAPAPVRGTGFDWRSVVGLPAHSQSGLEPQLEAILPNLAERFSQVGNFRSLVMLLTDLFQRDPSHQGVGATLNSVLSDWSAQLEKQGRGPEAGQVAAWSLQLLGARADWAQPLLQRFPAQAPGLPDLGSLNGPSAPSWMNWVGPLRDDPARFQDAAQALGGDHQGLQSLFRHLAVQHPDHPDHVLNLGWAYAQTGQPALAMVHTQRSLQLRQQPRAFQLLQKIYTDLGQTEMAQRVAQQLAQLKA